MPPNDRELGWRDGRHDERVSSVLFLVELRHPLVDELARAERPRLAWITAGAAAWAVHAFAFLEFFKLLVKPRCAGGTGFTIFGHTNLLVVRDPTRRPAVSFHDRSPHSAKTHPGLG